MGAKKVALTTPEFIVKAIDVHGYKYDYSKVVYVRGRDKVIIICPIHGEFLQRAEIHLRGSGCKACGHAAANAAATKDTAYCLARIKEAHGDRYGLGEVVYTKSYAKVKVICYDHGPFYASPDNLYKGKGCPKCGDLLTASKLRNTTDDFITKAMKVHGYKYGYKDVNYIAATLPVTITCPTHGNFEQVAINHLSGYGCSRCRESKGEKRIADYLDKHNIEYVREKKFIGCRHRRDLPFDFYLPHYSLAIEYHGKQHYMSSEHFGGEESFRLIKIRDRVKIKFMLQPNNRNDLLIIPYTYQNRIEPILDRAIAHAINKTL